jgi:hypothetical protein
MRISWFSRRAAARCTMLGAGTALALSLQVSIAAELVDGGIPAVSDERLAGVRGGFTNGGLDIFFGITRDVLVNGQVVATTRLVVGNVDRLFTGGMPTVETIGNVLMVVQVGPSNLVPGMPANTVAALTGAASSGSTPAAQSVAGAGPVPTAAPAASSAPQGALTPTPAATASQAGGASLAPGTATTPSASTVGSPALSPAMSAGGVSITVMPAVAAGQLLVLPNAAAIVTAVQNTANDQLIQTRTQIDATLSALSALRSGAFAAALQDQARAMGRP